MNRCPACGFELPELMNFCPHCGVSLAKLSGDTTSLIPVVVDEFAVSDLDAEDRQAVEDLAPGTALLLIRHGSQAGARYLIKADVVTAGRHPRCDIFLDDITVSRHHARFVRRDSGIWICDENSLNGTYLNRELVENEALLKAGDEVQIGKFRMVFLTGQS